MELAHHNTTAHRRCGNAGSIPLWHELESFCSPLSLSVVNYVTLARTLTMYPYGALGPGCVENAYYMYITYVVL